jgi:hypothetical protein
MTAQAAHRFDPAKRSVFRGRRRRSSILAVVAVLGALLISTVGSGPSEADGDLRQGNQNCAQLIPGALELRINAPADGPFSVNGFTVNLDVRNLTVDHTGHAGDQTGSQVFDFTATGGVVTAVAVKGGPDTQFFDYRPNGVTSGTALHAPVNPSNQNFYGLSHISFCYVPVVPDKLRVTKVNPNQQPLANATFQLWRDTDGTAGLQATDTLVSTCTTLANGICEFALAANGTYFVVETVAPSGYVLPSGPVVGPLVITLDGVETLHQFTVTDQPTPGRINVTKTNDDNPAAPLNNAVFTLYTSDGDLAFEPGSGDTVVGTCTTGVSNFPSGTPGAGACSFLDLAIGEYWLDETGVPANHTKASNLPRKVTIDLTTGGDVENVGPLVNPRQFTKIILVCHGNDLYPSGVTETSATNAADPLTSLAQGALTAQQEAALCALGGARFEGNQHGNHTFGVNIPQ